MCVRVSKNIKRQGYPHPLSPQDEVSNRAQLLFGFADDAQTPVPQWLVELIHEMSWLC